MIRPHLRFLFHATTTTTTTTTVGTQRTYTPEDQLTHLAWTKGEETFRIKRIETYISWVLTVQTVGASQIYISTDMHLSRDKIG